MRVTDSCGLEMTSNSFAAVAAWSLAVEHFLSHAKETPIALARVLELDPHCTLAWSAKGLLSLLLARAELKETARDALLKAEGSVRLRGGTNREVLYLEALRRAIEGSFVGATAALERVLADSPRDSFAAKLSQVMRLTLGDAVGMRHSIERVVARAGLDHPHFGYLLGCLAFALEETGAYPEAERLGLRALERAPRDVWGLHAVGHVYEMTGRSALGAEFIASRLNALDHCNNFGRHVYWHLALFKLDLGDLDGALGLYDQRVRAEKTDDFRDIANAVSLLTRLEFAGAEIGRRWEELGEFAEARAGDRSLAFASLHYALALIGAGRQARAQALAQDLLRSNGPGEQAIIAREIGAPIAAALSAFGEGRNDEAAEALLRLRPVFRRLGGSRAQRDLFEQILIEAALRAGFKSEATVLLRERLAARASNSFAARRLESLLATGEQSPARIRQ